MKQNPILGRIHSFQSLGTVDGPGVRFVVFMQGCPLRCHCCHNPDTWDKNGGKLFSPQQVVDKVLRYKEYFGDKGGITISGGEPLLQPQFLREVFKLSHENNINTCLDTSGFTLNDNIKEVLSLTDRVLLDIKYTNDIDYKKFTGVSLNPVIEFLSYLEQVKVPVTIRQVIIPTINDTEENIEKLNSILKNYSCVDRVELLPFKKICQVKYDQMNIPFPFKDLASPKKEKLDYLNSLIKLNK